MKNNNAKEQYSNFSAPDIPEIEIIDLEAEDAENHSVKADSENVSFDGDISEEEYYEDDEILKKKFPFRINMHIVLLVTFIIVATTVLYKFFNWGEHIDLEEIFKDGQGTYEDTLDSILPLIEGSADGLADDGVTTILTFGNGPFADDRDSEESLASIIEGMTDAVIYNCAVEGSYLAALSPQIDSANYPMDAFNFYWLCTLATGGKIDYFYDEVRQVMGDAYPAEGDYVYNTLKTLDYNTVDVIAIMYDASDYLAGFYDEVRQVMGDAYPAEGDYVYNTLKTLDYNTVDVIAIMYDASDYLAGHAMYSDQNPTDIQQFTGNMEAGIELLQATFPNSRIIVMSPTYAFAIDEETGEYVSSDMYTYGDRDVLSTYVIKQYASAATRSVTFVDNLYGTITEENAHKYLKDNLHLNVEGRKKVAERFVYALNYFEQ